MNNSLSANMIEPKVSDRSIGEIIRHAFKLTPEQIEQIITQQEANNCKFGEAAVNLGFLKPDDVLWALSQQFEYPYNGKAAKPISKELVLATNPFSEEAEIFRDLRSEILNTVFTSGKPRKSLAIVSPNYGEGKSFFAANLAVAFSQLGGRTLLVDADMRTPRQQDIFQITESKGLSAVLSGRSEVNLVCPIDLLPSLYVLPVGVIPPNPLELVQRGGFSLLLSELQMKFDYVIVDTPAASHGADAKVIASKCGAAAVISRKNQTSVNSLQALVQDLRRANTHLCGVLVNGH
jgi:protein-tyrosine kinase